MKTVEWAWNSEPDTPDEKLVLIAMARETYRTPLEALAIVGSRVLRHAACDMTPSELDAVLASLERQGIHHAVRGYGRSGRTPDRHPEP